MKKKVKIRAKLILFIFIVLVTFGFFTSFGFSKQQINTYEFQISTNDTIWSIAKDICKNNDKLNIQNVILEIKKVNNLDSSDIYAGQIINIPIY